MYYFAYGSNMNHQQMEDCCPSSKFLKRVYLKDYKFVYDGWAEDQNGAVGNIVKSIGHTAWGGLFKITQKHLVVLDRHEEYPQNYNRKIVKVEDGKSKKHYTWTGDRALGGHPVELGTTPTKIKKKSGKMGKEYVDLGEKRFREKYPNYPLIEKGLKDFEDRLSGPSIRKRLKKAINLAKRRKSADLKQYLSIERVASKQKRKDELECVLTSEALKGNPTAIQWIKDIASEIGQALAAFINAYQNEEFVKHLVLVSGINEKLGKDAYESDEDKIKDLDIYMKTLCRSTKDELCNYFNMNEQKAEDIVKGIVRSQMDYSRELVSYSPIDEEMLAVYVPELGNGQIPNNDVYSDASLSGEAKDSFLNRARKAYRYIGISMGGSKLVVSINDGYNNIVTKPFELRWDDDSRFDSSQVKDTSKTDEIMDVLVEAAIKLVEDNKVDKSKINIVAAGLAGPVDKKKGIFGSDFKAPNLPFNQYPFRGELTKRLSKKGIKNVWIEMYNDAEAALRGESFSPNGALGEYKDGGVVIIGSGINIAVKRRGFGFIYHGENEEIKEAGHNLYQIKDKKGRTYKAITYFRVGKQPGKPSQEYRQIVIQGAKDCKLPVEYIKDNL